MTTKLTADALKACPFCGENCAELVINQGDKWAHYEPSCLEVRTGYQMADDAPWRKEAAKAWNTRAYSAPKADAGMGKTVTPFHLLGKAISICLEDGKCSVSYIQRRLEIGYSLAYTIIEEMERLGIISDANHLGKRTILVPTPPAELERGA